MIELATFEEESPIEKLKSSPKSKAKSPITELAKSANITSSKSNDLRMNKMIINKDIPKNTDKSTLQLEKSLILSYGKCTQEVINKFKIRFFQLDETKISQQKNKVLDSGFQSGLACLFDAVIVRDHLNQGYPTSDVLFTLQTLSVGSIYGNVFLLFVNGIPLYVVKVSKLDTDNKIERDDSLYHEAFIGMAVINKLQSKVPNFVRTFGVFRCLPPVLLGKQVVTWCKGKGTSFPHLLLENVDGKQLLDDTINKLSVEELLQIILQLLNALKVAHDNYDFTHYDLLAGNVLIQDFPQDIAIPYYNVEKVSYLITRKLVKIIDFGTSHVTINGVHFGKNGLEEEFNIKSNRSFPHYDIYKFLLSCGFEVKDNPTLFDPLKKMFNFYNDDNTFEHRVNETDKYYPKEEYLKFTIDDMINHINKNFNITFISEELPDDTLYTICGEFDNECTTLSSFESTIFRMSKLPTKIIDYYRALEATDKLQESYSDDVNEWLSTFNVNSAFEKESEEVLRSLDMIKQELEDTSPTDEKEVLLSYFSRRDRVSDARHWFDISESFSDQYEDDNVDTLNNIKNNLEEIENKLREREDEIMTNIEDKSSEERSDEVNDLIVHFIDRYNKREK